jgi:hypothetical protein
MMAAPKKKKREPTDAQVMRKLFPKKVLDRVKQGIPASKQPHKH